MSHTTMIPKLPTAHSLGDATRTAGAVRPIGVGLLAMLSLLASPAAAHASMLSPEAEDAVAKYIAIFALFFVPLLAIGLFWIVHVMPEKIAHQRHHPQFEAIRTLCLLSLVFGGILWPLAWLWAYTKPVGYKLAYGTDKHPDYYKEHGIAEPDSPTADIRHRIGLLEERGVPANDLNAIRADLAALETRLAAGERSEAR
jgi:hypothetical protein